MMPARSLCTFVSLRGLLGSAATRIGGAVFLLSTASACAAFHWHKPFGHAAKLTEQHRHEVPKAGAAISFHVPNPTVFTLNNELSVLVVPRAQLPLVQASLVIRGGSASDPVGQEGISSLLAEAAKLGTHRRGAAAIAEQMELLGASLDVAVATESTSFATQALKHALPEALDILADVALHPSFAPAEVARAQAAQLAELEQLASSPGATAQVVSRKLVFGNHPYGHTALGSRKSVAGLKQAMLSAHHEQIFVPAQAALVLAGDIDEPTAKALAERYFGHWAPSTHAKAAPQLPMPAAQAAKVALIDRPGSPQAECQLASLGISREAPEYPALVLANAILGGMFNSRINMNLREAKGWTYGARASLTPLTHEGLFSIQSAIRTDVAVDGIGEMLAEADKMQATEVSQEELKAAKSRHVLSVAGRMETLEQLASQTADLFVYDLPLDYWEALPSALRAVKTADVLAATRAFIVPSQLNVTVVGDRAKLEAKLLGLSRGPLSLFDAEGNPAIEAPAAKAAKNKPEKAKEVRLPAPAAKH